ncbi:hypothetical protein [Pseudalkalibacillus caeni]|uniref:Lipoprotein n=1 Tax=Exobacillus caeni TaxID=2574798 RepID=A0A5R9F3R8_9BACL|nr:hypothetical protein [Pseudalkalibacillus caeni]TLS37149.1 hypothetical protein FCL54_11515 [Pseudalkalibacillus caeni]
MKYFRLFLILLVVAGCSNNKEVSDQVIFENGEHKKLENFITFIKDTRAGKAAALEIIINVSPNAITHHLKSDNETLTYEGAASKESVSCERIAVYDFAPTYVSYNVTGCEGKQEEIELLKTTRRELKEAEEKAGVSIELNKE